MNGRQNPEQGWTLLLYVGDEGVVLDPRIEALLGTVIERVNALP